MTITSTSNAQIKDIRRLTRRDYREEAGLYLVETPRLVGMAMESGAEVRTVVCCSERLRGHAEQIVETARRSGIQCIEVTPEVFASMSREHAYQGMAAVVRQRWRRLDDIRPDGELCWVAMNAVQCPSNLGTILRVSDAVGGAGVILIGNATDPYHANSVNASLGAIFTQGIVRTSLSGFADWARMRGYTIVGTSPYGSSDYRSVEYPSPMVLFMGHERIGLSEEQQSLCGLMVRIPMGGHVDSHNVAVASSIILYEALSQRRA